MFGNDGTKRKGKITKIFRTLGVSRQDVPVGRCGDVVIIAGIPDIFVGETIGVEGTEPYEPIHIDPPTLMMDFLVNNSPFA